MSEAWSLHPQLERDTAQVGDLALACVLAINDADYPWLVLVPRRAGLVELADLEAADAARLMDEIALASRALRDVTACDKLNIAAIGNIVPQLHVHIIARWKSDPLWPRPVWGHAPVRTEPLEKFHTLLTAVRAKLGAALLAP
jgi:diadenosine tetraphosphate (Ap4A) HIT family hydrolase